MLSISFSKFAGLWQKYCITVGPKGTYSAYACTIHQNLTWCYSGTIGKSLAAIGKFPIANGKLMTGKTLAVNEEKISNAMTGKDTGLNW